MTEPASLAGIFITVFVISLFLTRSFTRIFKRRGIIDVPNERSSHSNPTPRGGGLAIILALLTGAAIALIQSPASLQLPGPFFWAGLALIAFTGFIDDKYNLPAYIRFILHFAAANLVYFETGGMTSFPLPGLNEATGGPVFNYTMTVFWIMALVNIYNFLDGIDGFAASQAIIAAAAMAVMDFGGPGFSLGLLTVSASLGFLLFNWRPAKIFMGDIGSAGLGYLFAAAPLYFTQTDQNTAIFAVGIFLWFFISDGAFTILRRLFRGEKIWEAHRSHLYQKLTVAGYAHDKVTALVMSAATLLIGLFFIFYFIWPSLLIWILPLAAIAYLAYYLFVMREERKFYKREGELKNV